MIMSLSQNKPPWGTKTDQPCNDEIAAADKEAVTDDEGPAAIEEVFTDTAADDKVAAVDKEAATYMAVDDEVAVVNKDAAAKIAVDEEVATADEEAAADNPSDGDEHQDEMNLRRSPRFGNRTSDIVVPKNAKPYVENVHPEKKRRRRKVANESTIWANEPDKRLMTWWKKELTTTSLSKPKGRENTN